MWRIPLVAELWASSPDFTLPGALWRVYLFREWYHRDPLIVAELYLLGLRAERVPGLERPLNDAPLDEVIAQADALLMGERTDADLEEIFTAIARAMRIIAAGDPRVGQQWIDDPHDALAYGVTTRARALVMTAQELERAASRARIGDLD